MYEKREWHRLMDQSQGPSSLQGLGPGLVLKALQGTLPL